MRDRSIFRCLRWVKGTHLSFSRFLSSTRWPPRTTPADSLSRRFFHVIDELIVPRQLPGIHRSLDQFDLSLGGDFLGYEFRIGSHLLVRSATECLIAIVQIDPPAARGAGFLTKTRPAIIARMRDHSRCDRVQIDVSTASQQILVALNRTRFVATLPERAASVVDTIDASRRFT